MNSFEKWTAVAALSLMGSLAANPLAANAAAPKACGLLTLANLQTLFPGATVTPPSALDERECDWAADLPNSDEYKINVRIRPNIFDRWKHMTAADLKQGNAAYGHAISGFGEPAVYDVVDGVFVLKSGYIVQINVLGSSGAAATEPKEIEVAKFVAAKFSV